MKYDKAFFDAGIERKHTRCVKWDAGFIGPDDLPMWVAGWGFACPYCTSPAPARGARLLRL